METSSRTASSLSSASSERKKKRDSLFNELRTESSRERTRALSPTSGFVNTKETKTKAGGLFLGFKTADDQQEKYTATPFCFADPSFKIKWGLIWALDC